MLQKRLYNTLSQKGIGREIKEKLNESFITGKNSLANSATLMSPLKFLRKESLKRTIRISQQEFDKRVNQAMIKYYEKFMTEIPALLKEIDEIKNLSDQQEKEYMEYLDKVIERD